MARVEEAVVVRRLVFVLLGALAACKSADPRAPEWVVTRDIEVARLPQDTDSAQYDLEVGLDGTMYLLVPAERHVRVFEPSGGLRATLNGGATPFVKPTAVGTVSGLLWVYDSEPRQIVLIRGNGDHMQTISLQKREPQSASRVEFQTMLRDQSMVLRETRSASDRVTVLRAFANGARDTVATYTAGSPGVMFSPLDAMFISVDTVAATADSTGFRVTKLNLVGDTLFTKVWRNAPPKQARGDTRAYLSHRGFIFAGQQLDKKAQWAVFDNIGKLTAQFSVPSRVRVIAVGRDYLYGLVPDGNELVLTRYNVGAKP